VKPCGSGAENCGKTGLILKATEGFITASYLETVDKPIILRNQDALSPFHRIAVDKDGSELLISGNRRSIARIHGGSAFFWALRGFLDTNPGKIFSQPIQQTWSKSLSALKILKFVTVYRIGIYRNFRKLISGIF